MPVALGLLMEAGVSPAKPRGVRDVASGTSVQRQSAASGSENRSESDEGMWERFGGDGFIRNVEADLRDFESFKANPQSGQQIDEIGIDASIKLFTDKLGGANMHSIFHDIKALATRKLGESGISKINELLAISNGTRGASADDIFNGVSFRSPGHQWTLKLASEETSLWSDLKDAFSGDAARMARALGTEVSVSYQNSLGAEWNYEKKLEVAGLSYGISVDFGANLGDAAKETAKELLGGGEAVKELGERFLEAKWDGGILAGIRAVLAEGWSLIRSLVRFPHASWEILKQGFRKTLSEAFTPSGFKEKLAEHLEPGFSFFKVKLGHEGVKAEPTNRYWGPGDLDGPVRSVRFLDASIATPVGEAQYKGIDALELLGNKGWSDTLSFPQLGEGETKLEGGVSAKVAVTLLEVSAGYAVSGGSPPGAT